MSDERAEKLLERTGKNFRRAAPDLAPGRIGEAVLAVLGRQPDLSRDDIVQELRDRLAGTHSVRTGSDERQDFERMVVEAALEFIEPPS